MDGWMDGWMDHCKPKVLKLRVKNTKPMGPKLNVFFSQCEYTKVLNVSIQRYSKYTHIEQFGYTQKERICFISN